MFQRHSKSRQDRKNRKESLFQEHDHHKIRRPILCSSEDVERMGVERSRARIMRQLTRKPQDLTEGEFSSYYYGARKNEPVYSVTSHSINGCERPHKTVIPAYPSLVQNLRWSSAAETSSAYKIQTKIGQNMDVSSFICRCRECGSKHCRGQNIGRQKSSVLKDNITRFADNVTMTPKLNDACCGSCTPVTSSSKMSDASVSGPDATVTNNCCSPAVSQVYLNYDPVSILKKKTHYEPVRDYEQLIYDNYSTQTEKKCRIADDFQEAVKDTEEDYYHELNQSVPMRSFPKVVRNKFREQLRDEDAIEPRKNIYNEGISDLMLNNLSSTPRPSYIDRALPTDVMSNYSDTSMGKKRFRNRQEMPYTHNKESKYHYDCKEPSVKSYCASNNSIEHLSLNIKKFKKTYASKPLPFNNIHAIRYPRKVLTSERDIESYIGRRH